MSSNKKWSKEEELVLLNLVKQMPHNLKRAFELAGEELNRSPKACCSRWYTVISKNEDVANSVFYCVSKKSIGRNRKNCTTILTSTEKRGFWRSIINKLFK